MPKRRRQPTPPRNSASVLCALALCAACGTQPKLATPAAPPPPPATTGHTKDLHEGVDQVALECSPSANESCNAIDDNCNGVIDEGCGYSGGDVQVTIGWDTGADIDLYVTDPSGAKLFYNEQNRSSAAGGRFDHDARGDCRPDQDQPRIENVYWPAPAPRGSYALELHYFGPCGDTSQTHVTISVAAKGKPIGIYRYQLKPEEHVTAVAFEVP
jgi:tRNA (guanosine-2'-O-)-methyltransferase